MNVLTWIVIVYLIETVRSFSNVTPIQSSSPPSTITNKKKAIIIGGGPIGLSTALILSNPPHSYEVTILESNKDIIHYDVGKAFLYNINSRGQTFTKHFPSIHDKLIDRSVPSVIGSTSNFMVIPGDPDAPLPEVGIRNIVSTKKKRNGGDSNSDNDRTSYWIRRHEMVEVLMETVELYKNKHDCDINVLPGQECVDIIYNQEEDCMEVVSKDANSDKMTTFKGASLIVGADGWKSKVRDILSEKSDLFGVTSKRKNKGFQLKRWVSPSTGLRVKVLQLKPQFEIPNNDKSSITSESSTTYGMRSLHDGPRNYLSLGLLPLKDNTVPRTANIIARPDHDIWKCNTGPELKSWLQTNIPRFDWDKLILNDSEWDRAAKEQGIRFPHCQYTPDMQLSFNNCGVALVGDSIHAFPPDIGQGINAGFLDVMALHDALSSSSTSLQEKLSNYEKKRQPEIHALIRLARFGAPYQYNQPHKIDRLRKKLWLCNVMIRTILNKLSFGIIPPSGILMSLNPNLSFKQIMFRADLFTRVSLTGLLVGVFSFLLKKGLFGLST